MPETTNDPYLYPGTNVLRNRLGIRDAELLSRAEADLTIGRIALLNAEPIIGAFDERHLRALHRHIFQDIYDWAGQFRTTPLHKSAWAGGPTHAFTYPEHLENDAARIADHIRQNDYFENTTPEEFALQGARVLADLNQLHPFREGNGRTQRAFMTDLGRHVGHSLDFRVVSGERMIQTSIQASRGELSGFVHLLHDVSDPQAVSSLRRSIEFFETKTNINWNNLYLATAAPGHTYTGRLVGRAHDGSGDFMIRTDRDQIIIGQQRDIPTSITTGQRLSFTARGSLHQRSLDRDVAGGFSL